MILVDSSIWIDHINRGNTPELDRLLDREIAVTHRHVIGEVALGSIRNRAVTLGLFRDLHHMKIATDAEVIAMIEWRQLHGTGIGYVDAHLLASVVASPPEDEALLWTRDKRLRVQAERLGVAAAID